MDPNNAIEIENVRKVFHIDKSTASGFKRRNVSEKVVLDGLTLNVRKGECLGVVGRNGSGKSTTLKMMSRIIAPDSGRIEVDGKIASILELGMGFNSDFTGRENIYVKSSMFGFSRKDTDSMIDRIIEFTGLGEQIDDPVRTYSSGMNARLAFAIAVNVRCDIIILDEVLSVGDAGFRGKCANVFKQMKKEGKTIILASHSMGTIESMCDRAVWIDKGVIREVGDPYTVSAHFEKNLTESYDTVLSLAQSGDTDAMCKLAMMLRDGHNVDKDAAEAERWFVRAADLGNTEAMIELGSLLASKNDIEGATARFSMAAEAGSQEAQIKLTEIQIGYDGKASLAVKRLRELSDDGNVRAMHYYADALLKGIAIPQNKIEAHRWFEKAALSGNIDSMLQLGINYRDGVGVKCDAVEAEKWLVNAANHGNRLARNELVKMFRNGISTEVDMIKAIQWLKESAKQGDAIAMYQLGLIYRDGQGVTKDLEHSKMWMSAFSTQQRIRLMYNLAEILRLWNRSDDECKESVTWYEEAATLGHLNSDLMLGIIYKDGLIITPDSQKSLSYFKKIAEYNGQAALEAANMYLRGNGIEPDFLEAFKYAKISAELGNPYGKYLLGRMYQRGIGVDQNLQLAQQCFDSASEYGNNDSKMALFQLKKSK